MTTVPADPKTYPLGTRVLYSKDPTFSDSSYAYVVANNGSGLLSLMVTFYQHGHGCSLQPREDCYHIDDPMVKKRPAEFWDGGNGVYKLAPIEQDTLALHSRVTALEKQLNDLLRPSASNRRGS